MTLDQLERPTARTWEGLGFTGPAYAANRRALLGHQPELGGKLPPEPAIHDGLSVGPDPEGRLRVMRSFRRQWIPIDETEEDIGGKISLAPGADEAADQMLVGCGTGERIQLLLQQQADDACLWVTESDPGVLTLAMCRFDFSAAIQNGRLRFLFGADLREISFPPLRRALLHSKASPWLDTDWAFVSQRLFRGDRDAPDSLLDPGDRPGRVGVVRGELLQREVSAALLGFGLEVCEIDIDAWSVDALERELPRLAPDGLYGINFDPRIAEVAGRCGIPYVAWEIDPSADALAPVDPDSPAAEHALIFCWRMARTHVLRRAGWKNTRHLTIGVDPRVRHPWPRGDAAEIPLLFVGSCMMERAETLEEMFQAFVAQDSEKDRRPAWRKLLAEVESLERSLEVEPCRPDAWARLTEVRDQLSLPASVKIGNDDADVLQFVGERLASKKRIEVLRRLSDEGLIVFGEADWKRWLPAHVYAGPAGHGDTISKLMSRAAVNLDINRIYQPDIVTLRTFEVMACGGFLLAESHGELNRLFAEGREFVGYTKIAELIDKLHYYRNHRDERMAIAAAGRQRVLEEHTVWDRVGTMLGRVAAWRHRAPKA